jgi:hypothetical protein
MTTPYLPEIATIAESCDWLKAKTEESWSLARIVESGATPYFWLEYSEGWPFDIFGDRLDGYLAPILYAPDLKRLVSNGDCKVTVTKNHDGTKFMKFDEKRMLIPNHEIRFLARDIHTLAEQFATPAPATPQEQANGKKWTPERLAILETDRKELGATSAAKKHGISTARIRQLLPNDKKKPASPFDGLKK